MTPRRIAVAALVVVAAVAVAATTRGSTQPSVPLFIFAGQSNMVGAGTRASELPVDLSRADPRTKFWDENTRTWTDVPSLEGGVFGPDVSAVHLLASRLHRTVAAVKVAVNGSSLVHDWDPTRPDGAYAQMRAAVSDALLTKIPGVGVAHVAGFFWMQGETDGIDPTIAAAYDINLGHFIEEVRSDFANNTLPFILGRVRLSELASPVVRMAQADLAARTPDVRMVDTDDLGMVDGLHYGSQGIITLGSRFAEAYLRLAH